MLGYAVGMKKEDDMLNSARERAEKYLRDAVLEYKKNLPNLSSMANVIRDMQPQIEFAIKIAREHEKQKKDAMDALSSAYTVPTNPHAQRGNLSVHALTPPPRPVTRQELEDIIEKYLVKRPESSTKRHIELSLSSSGRLERIASGHTLVYSFMVKSKRAKLVYFLQEKRRMVPTATLIKYLKNKPDSLYKTIKHINGAVGAQLQLYPDQNFILGERGQGYQINPLYNIVTID